MPTSRICSIASFACRERLDADGNRTPPASKWVSAFALSSTQTNHDQGAFQITDNQLDFAIEGDGFFKVTTGQGSFYTRAGNFNINANNQLVMGSATQGWVLDPNINIPSEATNVVIAANGEVSYRTTDLNRR